MKKGLYSIKIVHPSYYVFHEHAMEHLHVQIDDVVYRIRSSPYAENESEIIHFRSGLKTLVHNDVLEELNGEIDDI